MTCSQFVFFQFNPLVPKPNYVSQKIKTFINNTYIFLTGNRIVLRDVSFFQHYTACSVYMKHLALPLHVAYLIQILEHFNLKLHLIC